MSKRKDWHHIRTKEEAIEEINNILQEMDNIWMLSQIYRTIVNMTRNNDQEV